MALENVLKTVPDGLQVLIGYEIEFVLLDKDANPAQDLDKVTGYASMAGFRSEKLVLMEEICDALELAEIAVQDFHTEIADQLEITLYPAEPMRAIDSLMLAQETIRTVALKHGYKASMAPKPSFNGPQNGLHTHVSLNPLPESAPSFLQGVLDHIKTLCAIGMPTFDSYTRVIDYGAGSFIGWGTENRDLPIRKIKDHWEFRFVDGTANHYLFVAALLSAGFEGMRENLKLTYQDCNAFQDEMTQDTVAWFGMSEKMPTSLLTTLQCARDDEGLERWWGKVLKTEYLRVKEKDWERMKVMNDEERRQRYLLFF